MVGWAKGVLKPDRLSKSSYQNLEGDIVEEEGLGQPGCGDDSRAGFVHRHKGDGLEKKFGILVWFVCDDRDFI